MVFDSISVRVFRAMKRWQTLIPDCISADLSQKPLTRPTLFYEKHRLAKLTTDPVFCSGAWEYRRSFP
jgi:hypothetical protein